MKSSTLPPKGAKIIPLRPKTFTKAEAFIEAFREEMFTSGMKWEAIAESAGLSKSTIQRLASGQTNWPRATTLFPIMEALGVSLKIERAPKFVGKEGVSQT